MPCSAQSRLTISPTSAVIPSTMLPALVGAVRSRRVNRRPVPHERFVDAVIPNSMAIGGTNVRVVNRGVAAPRRGAPR